MDNQKTSPVKLCKRGHLRTSENVNDSRQCKLCQRLTSRQWYERNRELTIQRNRDWRRANPQRNRALGRLSSMRYDNRKANESDRKAINELLRVNPWVLEVPELKECLNGT